MAILRERAAVRARAEHLRESSADRDDPETEAASWFRGLSVEQRARLESDAARLGSAADDLGTIAYRDECVSDGDLSSDSVDVLREFAKLKEADPTWFADWRRFEASLEGPDFPAE